jgi:hypothetical protein
MAQTDNKSVNLGNTLGKEKAKKFHVFMSKIHKDFCNESIHNMLVDQGYGEVEVGTVSGGCCTVQLETQELADQLVEKLNGVDLKTGHRVVVMHYTPRQPNKPKPVPVVGSACKGCDDTTHDAKPKGSCPFPSTCTIPGCQKQHDKDFIQTCTWYSAWVSSGGTCNPCNNTNCKFAHRNPYGWTTLHGVPTKKNEKKNEKKEKE